MKKSLFFICLTALVLTSCENFLKGSDLRDQLEEAIEIANTSPVTFIVTADENSGTLKTFTLQLKKKNTFDVVFEPSETYKFIKWEVLDRTSKEPVEGILKFEDETNPETKGIAIAPREGLEIHAKCLLQPAVVSISPDPAGQNQVSDAIKIKFNMPVNDSIVELVTLLSFGQDMSDLYFEKPLLNSAKDELTIRPKANSFITFIKNQNKGFADIRVTLSTAVTADINGEPVPLLQNKNTCFDFHYILTNDNTEPFYIDYYLSRTFEEPLQTMSSVAEFNEDIKLIGDEDCTVSNFVEINTETKIFENTCGEYIYIYGQYREADSAISKIRVYEQFCGVNNNWYFDRKLVTAEYNIDDENVSFFIDSEKTTNFCIKHVLKSEDGAVRLSIEVEDAYGNINDSSEEIAVFKMTTMPLTIPGKYSFYNERKTGGFNEQSYNKHIKTLTFAGEDDGIVLPYCASINIPYSYFTIKCEYRHKNGSVIADEFDWDFDYYWNIDLDVDRVSGLQLKLIVSDVFGHYWERIYNIPESEEYKGIQIPDSSDPQNKADVIFYYVNSEQTYLINQLVDNNGVLSSDDDHEYDEYDVKASLDKDIVYRFIPCVLLESDQGTAFVYFYTEVPGYKYSINNPDVSGSIELAEEPYYSISKNAMNEVLDVKVKIKPVNITDYDEILLMIKEKGLLSYYYNTEVKQLSNYVPGDKYVSFAKNLVSGKFETECSVSALTEEMFNSDSYLYVYGVKNGTALSQAEIHIQQFTDSDTAYDNYNESYIPYDYRNISVSDCDTAVISFGDNQTGISTINSFIIEGSDIFTLYGSTFSNSEAIDFSRSGKTLCIAEVTDIGTGHQGTVTIPRWMFTDTGFSYYLSDKAGNVCAQAIKADNSQDYNLFRLETEEGGQNSVKTKIKLAGARTFGSKINPEKIIIYTWNDSKWNNPKEVGWTSDTQVLVKGDNTYSENKFIRIVLKLPDNKTTPNNRYTHPAYIYTGKSNTGTKDYIYPAYNGIIAINSDAPVLARTVVTGAEYDECKNWSASEWENGRKCIKEEVLACDGSNHAYYKMYNKEADIESATCYAVIVHFADGTKAMSQIMQK